MANKLNEVLANWLREANSSVGKLSGDVTSAEWVAKRLVDWLKNETKEPLESAETALQIVRKELTRFGGWNNKELGEALHELIHIEDSLGDLRSLLDLAKGTTPDKPSTNKP